MCVVQLTFKLYSIVNKVHSFKSGKISVIARQHNTVSIPGNLSHPLIPSIWNSKSTFSIRVNFLQKLGFVFLILPSQGQQKIHSDLKWKMWILNFKLKLSTNPEDSLESLQHTNLTTDILPIMKLYNLWCKISKALLLHTVSIDLLTQKIHIYDLPSQCLI